MLHDSPSPTSDTISESPKEKPPVEVDLPLAQTSSPPAINDLNATSSSFSSSFSSSSTGVQVEDESLSQSLPQEPEPSIARDRERR